jgi:transcription elongation factor GreA
VNAPAAATVGELLVTADGYEQLRSKLDALRTVRRQDLTESLREARLESDPENAALYDLLEEQAQLEARISVLEEHIAAARVAPPPLDGSAAIGSRVRVRHRDADEVAEYVLVGPIEADIGNGRVSIAAPVGRALVGRRRGETVTVEAPGGKTRLEILSVDAPVERLSDRRAATR